MKKGIKILIICIKISLIAIILLFFIVGGILYKNYRELPVIEEIIENYRAPVPTTVYDRNGVLIDSIFIEKRTPVKIDQISDNLKNAFLAIEDKTFYAHHGIYIKRLMGAIVNNLKGNPLQGASTITQQLAKNAFLSNERRLSRKIKELLITFEMERMYTKTEIFEKYLNEIYFGSGAYGAKAASEQFFKKDPLNLNIAEGAVLAGIPNRPGRYNPYTNLEHSLKRARLIMNEMKKDNMITEAQYQKAIKRKFVIFDKNIKLNEKELEETTIVYPRESKRETSTPDFTDLVYEFFKNEKTLNGERIFTEEMLNTEGLKIYTTLDLDVQKIAKEVVQKNKILESREGLEMGMATIDSETGEIISVIGGVDYKSGNFNRSSMAKRQIGSTGKPFLYFAAIVNGEGMENTTYDSPVKHGKWQPRNANNKYLGNMTSLEAMDRSVNTISVKLLEKIGVPKLKQVIKETGANFNVPDNLTAALGSYEGTAIELAQAYAPFSNGGYSVKPFLIKKIEDRHGNILYLEKIEKDKVFDSLDVSLINFMLQSSVENGTSRSANVPGLYQGGKTGTTNKNRTVWYAGITSKYITTVYFGYDDNRPIRGMYGGNGPGVLWREFYTEMMKKHKKRFGRFKFMDTELEKGGIISQKLNSKTGFISSTGRNFILKSGKISLEREEKYQNGIRGILRGKFSTSIKNNDNLKIESVREMNLDSSVIKRLFRD